MSSDSVPDNDGVPETIHKSKHIEFTLHGVKQAVPVEGFSPKTTLNHYLRQVLNLTDVKYNCGEGGCGLCTVVVTIPDARTNVRKTYAVNSCLVPILSCHGWDIKTAQGIGNRQSGYHDIQKKMIQFNATQCGYCSPGMAMNMYALLESGKTTMEEIEDSFGGNLCRCTGYRPILTAFKSMASNSDEALLGITPDIEELDLCGPKKQQQCGKASGCCKLKELPTPVVLELSSVDDDNAAVWFRVSCVKEIYELFQHQGNRRYRLVAGNTANGVYPDMADADYYIDICRVVELKTWELNTSGLVIGANTTLNEAMDIFKYAMEKDTNFAYLSKFVEHVNLVATVQVRNIGTIAGNLTIKHEHSDFPSDIFVLLETVAAKLIIYDGVNKSTLTPNAYLGTNMTKKIIYSIELPPLDSTYKLETYKIMPRAQNAHANINAGFLFKLRSNNIVDKATIVYGGISGTFVHATNSEQYIVNKTLTTSTNMQMLYTRLNAEIMPVDDPPKPSPTYLRAAAIALIYKFILTIVPAANVSAFYKLGGPKLKRPAVSTGTQNYDSNKSLNPIGEPITKLEAADQVSGDAQYTTDYPDVPKQTYAAFVLGEMQPGSKLKSLDASRALGMKGVKAFLQAKDIPGVNSFLGDDNPFFYVEPEVIFVKIEELVKFYNQPVGMIVAENQSIAEAAAKLVEYTFDPATTSPLLSILDVLAHKPSYVSNAETLLPLITEVSAGVTTLVEGTFNCGGQYQFAMETQNVNVIPDDDGGLIIRPSTQWMNGIQEAVGQALKLNASKISVSCKRVGGGFGSKLTRSNWVACAAALAAYKLNLPVKMSLPLTTNMNLNGKRNPTYATYKATVDSSGKIVSLTQKIYTDVGAYANCVPKMQTLDAFTNHYYSTAFDVEYNVVKTDTPPSTWARSPGAVEGIAMIETIMEHVAYKLGKDAIDVRLANLNTDNELLVTMVNDALVWTDYRRRRSDIKAFNDANRWLKKGMAMVPMCVGLAFLANHGSQVSIFVADGTVAITHGGVEIGQGINTKAAQVVAYELGIDISKISVKPSTVFNHPNNMATGGSLTTESVCRSLKTACTNLKARIAWAVDYQKQPPETPWEIAVKLAWASGVNLTENIMFVDNPPGSSSYAINGVACCEVLVDILTGRHIVQRADIVEDVGDSSNPQIDIGQVEGAFIMAMGYWTSEHIVYDVNGRLVTNRTWTYKPPTAKDIPVDFRVKLPSGKPNPSAPYKNKAVSEPPTTLGFSVMLAIKDALRTARVQSDPNADPWFPVDGPLTTEAIFMSSLNDFTKYRLS